MKCVHLKAKGKMLAFLLVVLLFMLLTMPAPTFLMLLLLMSTLSLLLKFIFWVPSKVEVLHAFVQQFTTQIESQPCLQFNYLEYCLVVYLYFNWNLIWIFYTYMFYMFLL